MSKSRRAGSRDARDAVLNTQPAPATGLSVRTFQQKRLVQVIPPHVRGQAARRQCGRAWQSSRRPHTTAPRPAQ